MPSEKQLDQALHAALQDHGEFRNWFLRQLRYGAAYSKLVFCRSDHPWGKVRLILPNKETGALEPVDREGETDVLAVFEGESRKRLGVHIENKLASGTFTPDQPELCAARAEHWIGNDKYGDYHMWESVLLAPESFIARHAVAASKFMTRVPHEQVAQFIPAFASDA